jgi:type IV pilus assembly protein PilM
MAFKGLPKFESLAKIGNVLSSSVGETLGLSSALGMPIAIEFGTGALKVLQVTGDPPTLVAAACLETPDDLLTDQKRRLQFQLEGLPRLVRNAGFRGKRAVCAIPSWAIMCKHVSLPRAEGVPLASQVAEAVPSIFGVDPFSVVHRFSEVPAPDRPGKAEVIVTAVERELVDQLMGAVTACKLQPVGMHSEFLAVLRTFDHVHKRETDAAINTLYLDIGASTTGVMISHGKDLAFARVIQIGGQHLDEMIARQLKVDMAEARRMRLELDAGLQDPAPAPALVTAGGGGVEARGARADERGVLPMAPGFTPELTRQALRPVTPPKADVKEVIESLTDEVLMCLRYHEGQFPGKRVERAIFVGGEARHRVPGDRAVAAASGSDGGPAGAGGEDRRGARAGDRHEAAAAGLGGDAGAVPFTN